MLEKTKVAFKKYTVSVSKKELTLTDLTSNYELKQNNTNKIKLENAQNIYSKVSEGHKKYAQELTARQMEFEQSKKKLQQFYRKGKIFGLTLKERNEQFKKDVVNGSFRHTRRRAKIL